MRLDIGTGIMRKLSGRVVCGSEARRAGKRGSAVLGGLGAGRVDGVC